MGKKPPPPPPPQKGIYRLKPLVVTATVKGLAEQLGAALK